MLLGDRVKMRVARLLIEGHIVASPRAAIHRRNDRQRHPEVRASLREPRSIVWPAGPYAVTVDGRELTIGDVYAVHPAATTINADEAIAALDAGAAQGFQVHFRPGDDPYFYLTLADVSPDEAVRRSLAQWTYTELISRVLPMTIRPHGWRDATLFGGRALLTSA